MPLSKNTISLIVVTAILLASIIFFLQSKRSGPNTLPIAIGTETTLTEGEVDAILERQAAENNE